MLLKFCTFLMTFILVSCSVITEDQILRTQTNTIVPNVSPTLINKTSSITPTIEVVQTEVGRGTSIAQGSCIEVNQSGKKDNSVSGVLVLADSDFHQISILDFQTLEKKLVYESNLSTNVVTNQNYFAFATARDDSSHLDLEIRNAHGEIVKQIPWKENWGEVVTWVNDKDLLIDSPYVEKIPVTAHKVNPFIDVYQELSQDYPDIYSAYPPANWGNYGLVETVYHPTFQYVIYPSFGNNAKVVLWDIKDGTSKLSFPTYYFYGHTPQWSPDGNYFIINASVAPELKVVERGKKQELFQIGLDGEIKQLTQFTRMKDTVQFGNFSWSPDGKSIAFWVKTTPDPLHQAVEHLAVLNLASNKVLEYCVPGIRFGRIANAPIWTKDSRYMIVETQTDEQNYKILLVNLANQTAEIVANELIPIGLLND